jgi:hypothetical protein
MKNNKYHHFKHQQDHKHNKYLVERDHLVLLRMKIKSQIYQTY